MNPLARVALALSVVGFGCGGASAQSRVDVPQQPASTSTGSKDGSSAGEPSRTAKPTWPPAVDLGLTAPDGFHLLATSKDRKRALVEATGMAESFFKPINQVGRGNTSYLAQVDLAMGCIEATYDFPTLQRASGTGTAPEALAILNSPTMAKDVAHARTVAAAYGPNAAPILITPDGHHVVLEANNQLFWSKDGAPFVKVGGTASGPTLSASGEHVLFGAGGGQYFASVLDLKTGAIHRVTRAKGASMGTKNIYALADGSFLAVEDDGILLKKATKVCVTRVDPVRRVETEVVCVPSNVLSASVSNVSADTRFLMIHAERPDRVVVFDTSTWKKVTDVQGSPIYSGVDPRGRVAWNHERQIAIADGATLEHLSPPPPSAPTAPPATFVGFVDERVLVGYPAMELFEAEKPLKTLRDLEPCGFMTLIDAP